MQINILEYLETTVQRLPKKVAFVDEKTSMAFEDLYNQGRSIGSYLLSRGINKKPVIILMGRSVKTIVSFLGVVYAGNYYIPIDEEMPKFRINNIIKNICPSAIIYDNDTKGILEKLDFDGAKYLYEEIIKTTIDTLALKKIRMQAIDTDPIYVVFTSGSTGVPKGVVGCHRSVIDYTESLTEVLEIDEKTIYGNQGPFYFDACLKEIYPTLKNGSTTYIIPKKLFMFPIKLIEFLNTHRINTICWVVSALIMVSALNTFDKVKPSHLETVASGGEAFPIKQFNIWKNALPNASFVHLYGPTEATGFSCYYKVDRNFSENEVLPVGKPFKNTDIFLLNCDTVVSNPFEVGEVCIRGSSLSLGYYGDIQKTEEVFIQNPMNKLFGERIYKTGDLGRYNTRGELEIISRKDQQVKHMGHRIELGEIEANVYALEGIKSVCCIYDKGKEKIKLFYVGDKNSKYITTALRERLPRYMIPNQITMLETMPLTPNGKVDRLLLENFNVNKGEK